MFPHLPTLHDIRTSETGSSSCTLLVPQDHPSVRGHFPGLSIIPGAVLLGWVWAAAHALELPIRPEVRSTKYLQSILPGDRIEFIFSKQGSGVRVQVRKGQDLAAEFRLLYGKNVSKT